MCGNHGDPIYHHDLHGLISEIRHQNNMIRIGINTNGSYRSWQWWTQLANVMTCPRDRINFSIDGLPENNHQYRKNSDWQSIEVGIKTLKRENPKLELCWKWIVFRYNEHDIRQGMRLAKELGFNRFNVVWSDRYRADDEFTPLRSRDDIESEVMECQKFFQDA